MPADEILAYAKRHAVDVIVLGTHGRGRLATTLLGSVADTVVRRASCPVMIVRSAVRRRAAAAAGKSPGSPRRAREGVAAGVQ